MRGGKLGGVWARVRHVKAAVRERDGHRCTGCGMTAAQHRARFGRTLDVHRLTPGSPYTLEGCVTLCRPCHIPMPRSPRGGRRLPDGSRLLRLRFPAALYARLLAASRGRDLHGFLHSLLEANLPPYERRVEQLRGAKS